MFRPILPFFTIFYESVTVGPTDTASYRDARTHLTRPDTRPSVACGWAGAVMPKNRRKSDFLRKRDGPTDRRTDGPTDQRTDGPTDRRTDTPSYRDARRI